MSSFGIKQSNTGVGVPFIVDGTSVEAFLVRKAGDTGDVFAVNTVTPQLVFSATGTLQYSVVLAGTTVSPDIISVSNSTNRWYQVSFSDTAVSAPIWTSFRSRGTQASPTIVSSGDRLAAILHGAFDGTDFANSTGVLFEVDGTPGANAMPGRIKLLTAPEGSSAVSERYKIDNIGNHTFTHGANTVAFTASTENIGANFVLSATKTFATGALTLQREFVIQAPTYAFSAASTVTIAITAELGGLPMAGTNATFTSAVGQILGVVAGANAYADSNTQAIALMPNVPNGTSIVDRLVALSAGAVSDVTLGNQNRTITDVAFFETGGSNFTSTGTITLTNVYGGYFSQSTAGSGVTITNNWAAKFVGRVGIDNGRFLEYQGADVVAANDLTLGNDGNTFEITGATQINAITTANWQNGSLITLLFASTPTVKHNTAGGAGTAVILLAGAVDFTSTAGDTLTLRLSEIGGTQAWREIGRAVI